MMAAPPPATNDVEERRQDCLKEGLAWAQDVKPETAWDQLILSFGTFSLNLPYQRSRPALAGMTRPQMNRAD